MDLKIFKEDNYSIIQFPVTYDLSAFTKVQSPFSTITYTEEECSIVVKTNSLDTTGALKVDPDWKIIQVVGVLDFSLVGILANLSETLAHAKISIFAISTFNTDYLLVKETDLTNAQLALEAAGHHFK